MKRVVLVLVCLGAFSCGTTQHSTLPRDFKIELYSYGGFTGAANGVTVTGDGWAKRWSGRTAALRSVRDSVQVDPQHLARIDSLAASEELSALQSDQTGNITTVLVVQRSGKSHQVSFSGEQVPSSFPQPAKDLFSELQNLKPY